MGATFDRELERLLREGGCSFVREGKGSHGIWWSPITNVKISVPRGCVSKNTANACLKQAGLPKHF